MPNMIKNCNFINNSGLEKRLLIKKNTFVYLETVESSFCRKFQTKANALKYSEGCEVQRSRTKHNGFVVFGLITNLR